PRIRAIATDRSELFFRDHAVAVDVQTIESFGVAFPFVAGNLFVIVRVHLTEASTLTAPSSTRGAQLFARERTIAVFIKSVEDLRLAFPLLARNRAVIIDVHPLHPLSPIKAALT